MTTIHGPHDMSEAIDNQLTPEQRRLVKNLEALNGLPDAPLRPSEVFHLPEDTESDAIQPNIKRHQHRFTVAVEWVTERLLETIPAEVPRTSRVTRLRCESCPEEVER